MSGRRGRSQARRTGGNGIPGWAWLVVGLVLGAAALWFGSSLFGGERDFLRPRPNPDATPPAAAAADDPIVAEDDPGTRFDFYTLLPGDGVAMSDEELAASARAEAEAAAAADDTGDADTAVAATPHPDAADLADAPASGTASIGETDDGARYVLQAGAFGEAGDAEAVKARIALLGLGARVEPATIDGGRTVYRVRMGPYDSAAALAEAKRKLADGGLPSLAIRAR